MSIMFFIATWFFATNGIEGVGMDFFIAYALFCIADYSLLRLILGR